MYNSRKHLCFVFAFAIGMAYIASPLVGSAATTTPIPVVAAASTVDTTQPVPVETVVVNQDVSIPYGQWISDIGKIAQSWLTPVLLFVGTIIIGKYVPLPLRGLANSIMRKEAEALIDKAIKYGVNATAGASHDATLTIPVANGVIRNSTNYAVQNGWPKLIEFLDGPNGIMQKIFARLNLPPEATAGAVGVSEPKPASQVVAAKNIKVPEIWKRS